MKVTPEDIKQMNEYFNDNRRDTNMPCARCKATERHPEGMDPCLGKLPGVNFACCGHGFQGRGQVGYIAFTNGTVIRFKLLTVEHNGEKLFDDRR